MEPHRSGRATEHASGRASIPSGMSDVRKAAAPVGILLLAAAACAESAIGGSFLDKTARIDLSHEVPAARPSSAVEARGVSAAFTVDEESDFVVDSVDVVIRQVQVGREGTECVFRSQGSSADADGPDCEELGTGVTIVQGLPVDDGFQNLLPEEVPIEPGTWNRLEFEFNVLEADPSQPEDQAVLEGRSELRGASVMIQGTFGGEEFTLFLAPDDEVTLPADPPLVLEDDDRGGVVIVWNVSQWFDDGEGGVIDPVAASADTEEGEALRDEIVANLLEALAIETSAG